MLPGMLHLDLLQLAANFSEAGYFSSLQPNNTVQMISYDDRFPTLVGDASWNLIAQRDYQFV